MAVLSAGPIALAALVVGFPPVSPLATNPRGEPLLYEGYATPVPTHGPNILDIALSPDGKGVISVHAGIVDPGGVLGPAAVWFWNRQTGRLLRKFTTPEGVSSAAFTPDGKTLVTGCSDGRLRFYDADPQAPWAVSDPKTGHRTATTVTELRFIRDGKYLTSCGGDGTIRVWDVAAIRAKRKAGASVTFPPVVVVTHMPGFHTFTAPADGSFLFTVSYDQFARVWDLPATLPRMGATPLRITKARVSIPTTDIAVAVRPDGEMLVTSEVDGRIRSWDHDGRETDFRANLRMPITSLAFSPDGKHLAVGADLIGVGKRGQVRVWEVARQKQVAFRNDYPMRVLRLAFTPEGKTLIAAGEDDILHLWTFADPQIQRTFTSPGIRFSEQPLLAAAVSADGRFFAFATESRGVFIWDRTESKLVAELAAHADLVVGLAFSPDGKTLATASHDKTVKLWNTATWKATHTLAGHTNWVFTVAFSPDGKTLATGSYDKSVRLWDAATGGLKATWLGHTASVHTVAFSPGGTRLATAGADRTIRVWNIADGTLLHTLKGHKGAVRSVAFNFTGKRLASGSEDHTVKLWDAEHGKELRAFADLPDSVTCVTFSPKGQTVLAATYDGMISVCDPLIGRKRQTLGGHTDAVTGALFTDAGKALFAVSRDGTIHSWSAVRTTNTAKPLGTRAVFATAVSADPSTRTAVFGDAEGSLSLWNVKTGTVTRFLTNTLTGGVCEVVVSPGPRVAAVSTDGRVWVANPNKGLMWKVPGRHAAFSPDGKLLAVADGKRVVLYDAATGEAVRTLAGGHAGAVTAVAFDPTGQFLATAGDDSRVRLWAVATGEPKQRSVSLGVAATISVLAFRPDGKALAAVVNTPWKPPPDDMTGRFQVIRGVSVFLLPNGPGGEKALDSADNPPPLARHPLEFEVTGAAWVGKAALMSTATDGVIRMWDTSTPRALDQPLQSLRIHDAAIVSVAASGGEFVTAGEDMAVKWWPAIKVVKK